MHTPGPWFAVLNTANCWDVNIGPKFTDHSICSVSKGKYISGIDIDNAFLIAAAPDLLEALTNCLWLADLLSGNTDEVGNKIIAEARQAIKKAKGEEAEHAYSSDTA